MATTNEASGNPPPQSEHQQQQQQQQEQQHDQQQQHQEQQEEEPEKEEWEIRRDQLKTTADAHFRSKSYSLAIAHYADALQLDPTNPVLLSNKSAAHLANGEKSKALVEARKCVESVESGEGGGNGNGGGGKGGGEGGGSGGSNGGRFIKGYTRLAAAMASLGRYTEAAQVYNRVLTEFNEPDNPVAKRGLEECRTKERLAREEKEREVRRVQEELDRQREEKRRKEEEEKEKEVKEKEKKESSVNKSSGGDEEDDLLDDFFSEVEKATEKPKPPKDDSTKTDNNNDSSNDSTNNESSTNRITTELTSLSTSHHQITRLLQTNYEWKNLNPFYVLDIPHTIDDESIISARYRALSLLVHPDKCPNDAVRAKLAFEQVKKAMASLSDLDKRRHVKALVEQGWKQGKRDWEGECAKLNGANDMTKEQYEEGLHQAQQKATMKIFAEIEQKRREVERRKRKFEQRERAQEDEEKEKEKNEREYDKRWREVGRVEKRVGNWRDFQRPGGGGSGSGGGGGSSGSGGGNPKGGKKNRWG